MLDRGGGPRGDRKLDWDGLMCVLGVGGQGCVGGQIEDCAAGMLDEGSTGGGDDGTYQDGLLSFSSFRCPVQQVLFGPLRDFSIVSIDLLA